MLIYKIMSLHEWEEAQRLGVFHGSQADKRDGFIHLSAGEQVRETAARHFAGQGNLVLLTVDDQSLAQALKWETSRGGALFPHYFGSLPVSAVIKSDVLPWDGSRHLFPQGIA